MAPHKGVTRHKTYADGLRFALSIAELFADENLRMAGDTIFLDPILNRAKRYDLKTLPEIEAASKISEELAINGTIYSARHHAANDIAEMIRKELEQE